MDVVGRKVENQVHFWSLLGPFFVLLSIAVLLFKVSPHWYFPVSALIGIPLCVKWKMKGMAFALGCLFLFAGINFQGLELDDRYWHVGLALAMAFSFIVLTLSLEESQGLVNKVQLESQSRLDNFLLLDEKLKSTELERSIEREKAKTEIGALTQDLTRIHEDKQIFYKLAQLAKDELVQVRGQHDQLLQDLLYKKQQIAQLHERIEETEITIAGFVNSDGEKQIQTLSERIASLEQEKEIFIAKITLAQEEGHACQIEKERLTQELQFSQESEKLSIAEQENVVKEKLEQQELILALQNQCALLEHEKDQLLQAKAKWQQQSEQTNSLELQYRQSIEHLQQNIKNSQARLRETEKEKSSLELIRKELDEKLNHQEIVAKQKEEESKGLLLTLRKELDEEKQKGEIQLKKSLQHFSQQNQQEMKSLQDRYHQINEDLLKTRLDLEITQEAFTSTRNKENEYKLNCEQLQNELEISKKSESELLHQYEEKQKALIHEKNLLNENCKSIHQDLIQSQRNLDAKNETLTHMQSKIDELSNELNVQQSLYQVSSEQNQKLEALKSELKHALNQARVENQLIVQKMATNPSDQTKNKDSTAFGNKRGIESMYNQLKEQFQEKCSVLDATRRELFHANEELLKHQREYEEKHRFDQPSNERKLQRYVIRLGNQFEKMQENYQKEIDDLTQLVAQLLGQIKK